MQAPHNIVCAIQKGLNALDCAVLQSETALSAFTQKLKSFRPIATVLEAEIAKVRPSMVGPTMLTEKEKAQVSKSNDVMSRKRAAHTHIIEKERQKRQRAAGDAAASSATEQQQLQPHVNGKHVSNGRPADAGQDDDDGDDDDADYDGDSYVANRRAAGAGTSSSSGPAGANGSDAKTAAVKTMMFGDGVLSEGRFRDNSFYLSHDRSVAVGECAVLGVMRVQKGVGLQHQGSAQNGRQLLHFNSVPVFYSTDYIAYT